LERLIRYTARGAVSLELLMQDANGDLVSTYWTWARLLGECFIWRMVTCPLCQRGALRLIAVITQGAVICKILRHLKRAADPLPIAPAHTRQTMCNWVA